MLTESQAKQIQGIVGLAGTNVSFKLHQIQFNTSQGMCHGLCIDVGNGRYIVHYEATSVDSVEYLLHELAHVFQFVEGRELDCTEADEKAADLVEYVKGELV